MGPNTNNGHTKPRASILKSFDMNALRAERAKRSQGSVDLEAGINQVSPLIGRLEKGQTAKLPLPEGAEARKFVMGITAKLTNITAKGAAWAGRSFKVAGDGAGYVYVQRGEDVTPKVIKRGRGGGRKAATQAANAGAAAATGGTAAVGGGEAKVEAPGAKVVEHA